MKLAHLIALSLTVLVQLPAQAGDVSDAAPTRLGEHPAVLVARRGVPRDPAANFYLHPARLEWGLQRPLEEGEHPAVLVWRRLRPLGIDPNQFIVAHPARGMFTSSAAAASAIR